MSELRNITESPITAQKTTISESPTIPKIRNLCESTIPRQKNLLSSEYYRNKKSYCVENHWRKIFSHYFTITELRNLTELTFYRKLLVISRLLQQREILISRQSRDKAF